MPHHGPLNDKALEVLTNEVPHENVLTAVLCVNPGHPDNQGAALFTRAKNLLRDSGAPDNLTSFVQEDLEDAERVPGKSRAYYVWENGFHTVDVNLDLTERVTFGAPDFEALHEVIEMHPPTALALVDHERARLFLVRAGEIFERRRMENTLENDLAFTVDKFRDVDVRGNARDMRVQHSVTDPHADGGTRVDNPTTDYDLINSQEVNQELLFMKALVAYLEERRLAGEFERLLVAGPVKPATHLKSLLTKGLQDALCGEFSVEASAPIAQVLEAARPALEAAELEADQKMIEQARERGVRGPEDTLEAVQQGRVYQLIVAGDGSAVPVWQDTDTDSAYVFARFPEQGQSPLSGAPVEAKTLHDVLPTLRERFGVKVNFVAGHNEATLREEMDGVAGLTRY